MAFGYWLVENGRAIIEIHACGAQGQEACGRIAWLAEPDKPDGRPKIDMNNPVPELRGAPLCGLRLLSGLSRLGPGTWSGGSIYDSRNGSVWSVEVTALGPRRLDVRGYLGISLLGRSQIWTRQPDNRDGCGVDLPPIEAGAAGGPH
ncbi:MAG: DUF2147 domain-containing protein [Pikeienuella sp.]